MSFWNQETYAYINHVEDKGKVSNVRISTSRKDQKDERHYSNWFATFVGKAHERIKKHVGEYETDAKGNIQRCPIKILKSTFTREPYVDSQGQKQFPNSDTLTVFDFEFSGQQSNNTQSEEDSPY